MLQLVAGAKLDKNGEGKVYGEEKEKSKEEKEKEKEKQEEEEREKEEKERDAGAENASAVLPEGPLPPYGMYSPAIYRMRLNRPYQLLPEVYYIHSNFLLV